MPVLFFRRLFALACLVLVALSLGAQSVRLDVMEPNEERAAARPLTLDPAGASFNLTIHAAGDVDWFRFTIPGASRQTVIQTGGDLDTALVLLRADGQAMAENDDNGGDRNAAIGLILPGGDYLVRVSANRGGSGSYNLRLRLSVPPSADAHEPNEDRAAAARLDLAAGLLAAPATFHNPQDRDWYRLDVPAGGRALELATEGNLDTTLALYDADGRLVAENDDSDGLNAAIRRNLPAGEYRVAVGNYTGALGSYRLVARLGALPSPDAFEPDNQANAAAVALQPGPAGQLRSIHATDDVDWVKLVVTPAGRYRLQAISQSGRQPDTYLELYDEARRLLAEDDDSGEGLDAELTIELASGTYWLLVRQVADELAGDGSYRLVFSRQ
ncbi:MAG: hypothetical protein A2087_02200 [Spirochaetes bacterium GWD1_61_31]|nr:MAG: hypothetical protein A2Y37_11935 [Spirochaetes bacterium GWB1_60_80]OHD33897.1 MAG: hypothetical protein A2004_01305 [Spirochaetes bacterium GWC1_61_12]OHD43834.1 MAG: hypothetical protein A2087_02200 [Spirochaetes bacterium GWD1_61_31]OHD46077.1 MAG: hypothetical protein A2Y35_13760 [Spirochaetes bacterium GWE1_60_18]OHD60649.1 MAG: hypothetical protein A2Y32_08250 [Spirochaetes bacterium GWF1_60_12]HAP44267.1 hypothetical protein [Spirochaetaceae bacterium]